MIVLKKDLDGLMLRSIRSILEKEKFYSAGTEELKSMGHHKWVYPKPKTNDFNKVNWVCRN